MSKTRRNPKLLLWLSVFALVHAQYGDYGGYGGGYGAPAATSTSLRAASSSNGSSEASEAGEYGSGEYSEYSRVSSKSATIAHATCGALATMLLLPAGVMMARSRLPHWFPVHATWQLVLSTGIVCAAFGIAWSHFAGGLDTPHRRAATALFALVLAQVMLGIGAHFIGSRLPRRLKTFTGRSALHFVHWAMGIVIVGLGWAVAYLGLTSEWEYRGHGHPSGGWKAGWGVVIGVWIVLYALGLGMLQRQLRQETEHVAPKNEVNETSAKGGAPAHPELSYERSSF